MGVSGGRERGRGRDGVLQPLRATCSQVLAHGRDSEPALMQIETRRLEIATLKDEAVVLQQAIATLQSEQEGLKSENEARILQERATTEGQRQMVKKLKIEQQELKMELAAATDRAEALTARLEHLALKDGPPEQQLLAVELARLQVLCDSLKAQNDNLGQENAALWKERAGLKEELGSVSFHVRALRPFVLFPPSLFSSFHVRVLWAILSLLLDSVDLRE